MTSSCQTVMPERKGKTEVHLMLVLVFRLVALSGRWYKKSVPKHNRVVF